MSEYTPDKWVCVEITRRDGDKHKRILGSWYGGFAGSDSYRFSSGVTGWHDRGDHYEVENESGSVYFCGKNNIGMSAFTMSIFENQKLKLSGEGASIKVVEIDS